MTTIFKPSRHKEAKMTSEPKYFIVQIEHAIFGMGNTPEEAREDALEWVDKDTKLPLADEMPRYVGQKLTGAKDGMRCMTQFGEMYSGQMVLLTHDQAEAWGYLDKARKEGLI